MGLVFLLIRFVLGGYLAWHGAQHLNTYGREPLIAYAHARSLPAPLFLVPLSGLMLTIGGASLVTGVFPAAGVALAIAFLIPAAFLLHAYWRVDDAALRAQERRRFWRNAALAVVALAFLLIPQPWPMSVVR